MPHRFIILMYHMVSKPNNKTETKYACPPTQFDKHMKQLRRNGFNPVSLESIERHLLFNEAIPENAVAITLDDGFEDNYTNAFPILTKYQIPATIFLTTGCLTLTNKWMDNSAYPLRQMLNWRQIREMDNGNIAFGAHTVTHPKLPGLDAESAKHEISASKKTIEDELDKPCKHFAYPYGLFNTENRDMVEAAGYTLACTTQSGFNNAERDPFVLHRIEVYGNDSWWKLQQKITFGMNNASLFYPLNYYYNRCIGKMRNTISLLSC